MRKVEIEDKPDQPDFAAMAKAYWKKQFPMLEEKYWEDEIKAYVSTYGKGYGDCWKDYVLPLKEENKQLREALKTKLIEFGKWLKRTDNGTDHYDPETNTTSESIGYSPLDCFHDDIKSVEELVSLFLGIRRSELSKLEQELFFAIKRIHPERYKIDEPGDELDLELAKAEAKRAAELCRKKIELAFDAGWERRGDYADDYSDDKQKEKDQWIKEHL